MRWQKLYFSVTASAAMAFAGAAQAQEQQDEPKSAAELAKLVCRGIDDAPQDIDTPDIDHGNATWRAVEVRRITFFMASLHGFMKTPQESISLVKSLEADRYPEGSRDIWLTVDNFQREVSAGNLKQLLAFNRGGRVIGWQDLSVSGVWVADENVVFRCKLPDSAASPSKTGGSVAGSSPAKKDAKKEKTVDLRLRGNVEALSATGKERKTAAAASFGYERERSFQDDGPRKKTSTYSVKGVLGATILQPSKLTGMIGYVGYELKQVRFRPKPDLTPPAKQRDSDTDILKLGLLGHHLLPLAPGPYTYRTSINLAVDASYIFDFVKDSERYRARISGSLYHREGLLGLCGLGTHKKMPGAQIWTRCDLELIADTSVLTKFGTATETGKKTFGHLGGKAAFRSYLGETPDSGPFLSAQYTYLDRVRGDVGVIPNIENHSFELGHRWWSGEAVAVDVKASLTDGTNPDSLEDENKLTIGVGLIF